MKIVTKDGVDISNIKGRMYLPLLLAKGWREKNGFTEVVIVSGNDGKHKAGSLHYKGLAVDIRTRDLTYKQKKDYFNYIKGYLPKHYEIYNEKNHIHIEYDDRTDWVYRIHESA